MGDHVLVCFIMKILFILNHDWVVGYMRYTLVFIVVSIGIIELFQLVSIWHLFVYSYMFVFYICMLALHIVSNFNWYLSFTYIYRWFICASRYHKFCLCLAWTFQIETMLKQIFNWFNFQLVSYFKHMHIFIWYFIKGEKTSILFFKLVFYLSIDIFFGIPLPCFMIENKDFNWQRNNFNWYLVF